MFKVTAVLTFCSIKSWMLVHKFINTGSKTGKTRTWFEAVLIHPCSYVAFPSNWLAVFIHPVFNFACTSLMTYWNSDKLSNFKVNGLSWTVNEFTMFFKNNEWFYEYDIFTEIKLLLQKTVLKFSLKAHSQVWYNFWQLKAL